jgi:hypothetical protein
VSFLEASVFGGVHRFRRQIGDVCLILVSISHGSYFVFRLKPYASAKREGKYFQSKGQTASQPPSSIKKSTTIVVLPTRRCRTHLTVTVADILHPKQTCDKMKYFPRNLVRTLRSCTAKAAPCEPDRVNVFTNMYGCPSDVTKPRK